MISCEKGGLHGRTLGLDYLKNRKYSGCDPRDIIVDAPQNDMAQSESIPGLGLL